MKKNTRTLTLTAETILKLTKGGEKSNTVDPVVYASIDFVCTVRPPAP